MNKRIYILFRILPFLRKRFYVYYNKIRFFLLGIDYGKRMRIHSAVYISGFGKLKIGDDFIYVSADNTNPLVRNLKGSFYLGDSTSVIEIGDRVGMSAPVLWAKNKISIGNDVNIGGDCVIIDNDAHPHEYISRRRNVGGKIMTAPIIIEDDVWIGARCIILKGVHIGARSIIGAGSVVTNDIPSDCIAFGNPCRVQKMLR